MIPDGGGPAATLARRVEEASLNAWPGLRQMLVDGWVLRFSRGYTKRANSVTPLYPSTRPLAEQVARCEAVYGEHGLPCLFRLAEPFAPQGLDALLAARGYRRVEPTLVLHRAAGSAPRAVADGALREEGLERWLALHAEFHGTAPGREQTADHRDILSAIAARRATFSLSAGGGVVACGLGVLEGERFGLFDLVTAPALRNRGHGAQLVAGMLRWAGDRGAAHAYLQVVESNAPALHLYRKLGFGDLYRYAYRVPALSIETATVTPSGAA